MKTLEKTKSEKKAKVVKVKAKKDAAKDLKELFEDGLKDVYWAEKALLKVMPKLEKNATSAKLSKAIKEHASQTETQIGRLEVCFEELGKKPKGKKCDAMKGLIDEAKGILEDTEPGSVRDAGIIAAIQKAEHYEIATYGTLAAFAKVLKLNQSLKALLKS